MAKSQAQKLRDRIASANVKVASDPPATINDPSKAGPEVESESASAERKAEFEKKVTEERAALAKTEDEQEEGVIERDADGVVIASSGNIIIDSRIPPTVVAERLKNGQNPNTGEPWTREERIRYDRQTEQARQEHARAVRLAEEKSRREAVEVLEPAQPVVHTPTAQLTQDQKKAMQDAQDAGKGPIGQARARDAAHPDVAGRLQAEADMTQHEKDRENAGVDEETEKVELDRVEEAVDELEKDADDVQKELDDARDDDK